MLKFELLEDQSKIFMELFQNIFYYSLLRAFNNYHTAKQNF